MQQQIAPPRKDFFSSPGKKLGVFLLLFVIASVLAEVRVPTNLLVWLFFPFFPLGVVKFVAPDVEFVVGYLAGCAVYAGLGICIAAIRNRILVVGLLGIYVLLLLINVIGWQAMFAHLRTGAL